MANWWEAAEKVADAPTRKWWEEAEPVSAPPTPREPVGAPGGFRGLGSLGVPAPREKAVEPPAPEPEKAGDFLTRGLATIPRALAKADETALRDAARSDDAIVYDVFTDFAGPAAGKFRSLDLSTPEKASAALSQIGLPPASVNQFREVLDRRLSNAHALRGKPAEAVSAYERAVENRETAGAVSQMTTGELIRNQPPIGELGKRVARGATEMVAGIPEAVAVATTPAVTDEQRAAYQSRLADAQRRRDEAAKALADNPNLTQEERQRLARVIQDADREIATAQSILSIKPAQETSAYKAGDAIRQLSLEVFGTPDPKFDDRFASKLAEGAGSILGTAATFALSRGIGGAWAGFVSGGAQGAAINAAQVYREAKEAGASEDDARMAAFLAGALGTTEVLPIGKAIERLSGPAQERVTNALARRVISAIETGGEEALQETIQQVGNNLIGNGIYDPERQWDEGALESALIGAILGGGLGAMTPAPPRRAPLTEDDIRSPIPNDILSEGKAILQDIEEGRPPEQPPVPQAEAPNVKAPTVDVPFEPPARPPVIVEPRRDHTPGGGGGDAEPPEQEQASVAPSEAVPTAVAAPAALAQPEAENRPQPAPEAADRPVAAGERRAVEELPVVDETGETGEIARVYADGTTEIVRPGETQEPAVPALLPAGEEQFGPAKAAGTGKTDREQRRKSDRPVVLSGDELVNIDFDPETFQYKSGGDQYGVTDRLLNVRKWDTARAGTMIVYEYADGRRVVADGHQRLGLAKRLYGEGQDVAASAIIRREVDGYTPEDVMVQAALKNIAESDTRNPDKQAVIDAAKVLRARPDITLEKMNLPSSERSALGRNALALRELSDDAFGMVVNDKASLRSALAVAKNVPDKAAQADILNVVEKSGARNQFEADMVARQAAADTVTGTQESLFGSEQTTETLYLERARVMDQAIKRLRKDASAFKTILRDAGTIEGVGKNRVDRDASARKAAEDAAAQEYITRLANSKGPISDALTEAARTVKQGGNVGQAVTGFVQAVRSAIRGGGGESGRGGEARPAGEAQSPALGRGTEKAPRAEVTAQPAPETDLRSRPEPEATTKAPEAVAPPQASPEPTSSEAPTFEDFRAVLPQDSEGVPDVAGAGAAAISQAAGREGAVWKDLTPEQKQAALEIAKGAPKPEVSRPVEAAKPVVEETGNAAFVTGIPKNEKARLGSVAPKAVWNSKRGAWRIPKSLAETARAELAANDAPFATLDEAREWLARGQERHGKRGFTATEEYRRFYPAYKALYDADAPNRAARREQARREAEASEPRPASLLGHALRGTPVDRSGLDKAERTTLEDYAPKSDRRMTHVYAEAKGKRFYIGSFEHPDIAQAEIAKVKGVAPEARFYTTDRADSTSISGDRADFEAEVVAASKPEREPKGETAEARVAETERTDAGEQRVIPGAEQSQDRSEKAREGDRRREVEVRARQSKMRSAAPQEEPGGLFDTQSDLFDERRQETPETDRAAGDDAGSGRETRQPQEGGVGKKSRRIDDFGEVLEGARKHLFGQWVTKLKAVPDGQIWKRTLSEIWPAPDYNALLKDGADPDIVAFIHALRDVIPSKPRLQGKAMRWAKEVAELRRFATDLVEGEIDFSDVRDAVSALPSMNRTMRRVFGIADLYRAAGHDHSLGKFAFERHSYSTLDGKDFDPPKRLWVVERMTNGWPERVVVAETKEEALERFAAVAPSLFTKKAQERAEKAVKFSIISVGGIDGVFIAHKPGKTWLRLKHFDSVDDARKYLADNYDELAEKLKRLKDVPFERREENAPRVWQDYRNGQDVTPDMFMETFGFRGVQFGNYVEGDRRQQSLNDTFDALMDMAGILNLPPKALSLNGTLGLAFGARGKGGKRAAGAHYEPGTVVINLTKKRGAGSLAHEWWHALDNYFSRQRGEDHGYFTENIRRPSDKIRPEVVEAIRNVMAVVSSTEMNARSEFLDSLRSKAYWSTPPEMSARAFESYIIGKLHDHGGANDYLANIVSEEVWSEIYGDGYPYLKVSELPKVRAAFDNLFDTIQTEETPEGTVRIFQTDGDTSSEVAVIEPALPDMHARLKKVGLGRIRLEVAEGADFQGAFEAHGDDLRILIGASLDPKKTLNHEIIHALRNLNLFTDKEWNALAAEARKTWLAKYDIAERYADLNADAQIEEAVAEAFADFVAEQTEPGPIKAAFAKLRRMMRVLREWIAGNPSVRSVFEAIDEGKVGGRDRKAGEALRKEQRNPITRMPHRPGDPQRDMFDAAYEGIDWHLNNVRIDRSTVGDLVDTGRVWIQDQMLPLRRAEEAIQKQLGVVIPKSESAYYAEERYSGRTGFRLDQFKEQYEDALAHIIGQAKPPITLKEPGGETVRDTDAVNLWLYARHAKERNAHIAKINADNPDMQDGGSGMTNAEADAILKQAENSPHRERLEQIGKIVDKLAQEMIDWRVEAGLLSAEDAAAWRATYKHYVPLRGWAEMEGRDIDVPEPVLRGRRYNVRGPETRRALGRKSRAYEPLQTMLSMATEVIVRAEKNRVARAVYDLAAKYPSPNLWEVRTVKTRRVFNKSTGLVETQVADVSTTRMEPNEFAVKIDGKEHRIVFHDKRLAEALGDVGVVKMGPIIRAFSVFSRFFSAMNTMLSPPFVVVNAFRDMATAQITVGSLPKGVRGSIRKAMVRDWAKAMAGTYSGMGQGGGSSEWVQYFREFSEAGGKVSFWKIENPKAKKSSLEHKIWLNRGSALERTAKALLNPRIHENAALHWIERVNLSVDNAIRLAAFMEARKQGMTIEEAASLAKNLTVNFNRKGKLGPALNALFVFANAAIQGSHRILQTAKSRQVQAIIGGAVLFGLANDLLNAFLSETDDDGELEYDKIPDYINERNIILSWKGKESRVTIPLPYGFNIPFYMGQQLGKVLRGVKGADDAAKDVMAATFNAFSPLSGEDARSVVTPTLLDFVNQLAENRDWLGRPIRPEPAYADYGPQSYKAYDAPEWMRTLAQALNNATGGSPYKPGIIDISPEYFEHTFDFLGGGALRFAKNVGVTAGAAIRGEEIPSYRVPLLRKLYYKPGDWIDQSRYFEFRELVRNDHAQVKKARANRDSVDPEQLERSKLYPKLLQAERERKKLKDQINALWANQHISDEERQRRLKPLYERRHAVYIDFNKAYIQRMGPQAE